MTGPRIAPLPADERDPRTQELLDGMGLGGDDLNLFTTLARHPRLLKRWSAFGGLLLFRGTLGDRDREVLILRTAANTGAHYEWGHHTVIAERAGLDAAEVRALADPAPEPAGLREADLLLVRAADELHRDNVLGDDTWAHLAERYDEQQLIELCMVVGQYHLVAFTLRSLGVEPEEGCEPIPAVGA